MLSQQWIGALDLIEDEAQLEQLRYMTDFVLLGRTEGDSSVIQGARIVNSCKWQEAFIASISSGLSLKIWLQLCPFDEYLLSLLDSAPLSSFLGIFFCNRDCILRDRLHGLAEAGGARGSWLERVGVVEGLEVHCRVRLHAGIAETLIQKRLDVLRNVRPTMRYLS